MNFLLRKAGTLVATLFMVALIAFTVFRLIPGDPALLILGVEADPAAVATLHHQLGLDEPLYRQFGHWLGGILTGNLGDSLRLSHPVSLLIQQRLPVTVGLAALAMLIAAGLAIPLGVVAATHKGGWLDLATMALSQVGLAIPAFWAGILLLLVFAMELGWFAPGV
jgi:peptide/nickel transport system permease protein